MLKFLSVTAALILSTSANASLIGDEMTATWSYPPSGYFDTNTFIASNNVDLLDDFGLHGSLDVTDSAIDVKLQSVTGLSSGITWQFLDIDFSDGSAILDVVAITNYQGWSDSFLTFDGHNITVNFANFVTFDRDANFFHLAITPVPLPAAFWLFGPALISLIGFSRRYRS